MLKIINKKNCSGCTACVNICPRQCISMISDDEGFLYPVVDESKCIKCGLCLKTCPINNVKEDCMQFPKCYAAYAKDKEIVLCSSSGGIFSLIAEHIISKNGVVYGAGFDGAFKVTHSRAETIEQLQKFKTSKYLQSELGQIFKQVKEDLENKKMVLFTGTTCQIAGLKAYLKKDYENLLTQDIICHGVPSPLAWQKYLQENKIDNEATVNFRDKTFGWQLFCVKIRDKEKQIEQPHRKNYFMHAFLKDYILRPSCYDCKFKTIHRDSDITLADFWGIDNVDKNFNTGMGTSAVMIQTKKGEDIFKKIQDKITYKEVSLSNIVDYNPAYLKSAIEPKNRKKYMAKIQKSSIKTLNARYINKNIVGRVLRKLKRKICQYKTKKD